MASQWLPPRLPRSRVRDIEAETRALTQHQPLIGNDVLFSPEYGVPPGGDDIRGQVEAWEAENAPWMRGFEQHQANDNPLPRAIRDVERERNLSPFVGRSGGGLFPDLLRGERARQEEKWQAILRQQEEAARRATEQRDAEAENAIRRDLQPGGQLGRGSTRYQNDAARGYMKTPQSQNPALQEKRFRVPARLRQPGEDDNTLISQEEYHLRQKKNWVPFAQQQANLPDRVDANGRVIAHGSPARESMARASFEDAKAQLRSRVAQLTDSVRKKILTPEQAAGIMQQEEAKYLAKTQGKPGAEAAGRQITGAGFLGVGMRGAQAPAAPQAAAAAKPAAGGVKAAGGGRMVDPKVMVAGGAGAPGLLPVPGADPNAAADPKAEAEAELIQKPAPAAQGGFDQNALASQIAWLNYLARTKESPQHFALAGPGRNVPFDGMRDLQGVQGGAIDAFGDFLDSQQRRNAGMFQGALMDYPNQIHGQMALGAKTLAGNQQASVELKKAAAQLAAAQAQAGAAADVGRSQAFGQAFSGLGGAFQELVKRQTLNPMLALLAGLLGGGAGGGAGGMFNRKLPVGVNLGFPHYTPTTVSHGSGVGRIV